MIFKPGIFDLSAAFCNTFKFKICFRPGAGSGLWVLFLLPISIMVSVIKHPIVVMPIYKLTSLCCIGFVITSLQICSKIYRSQQLKVLSFGNLLGTMFTTVAIHTYLHKGTILISKVLYDLLKFIFKEYLWKWLKDCINWKRHLTGHYFILNKLGVLNQLATCQSFFLLSKSHFLKPVSMNQKSCY